MSVRIDEYNCREPDLIFVSAERMGIIGEQELTAAPDLIMEIVSAGDSRREVVAKQAQYERIGVREFWVIDQPQRRLRIHFLNEAGRYELLPVVNGIGRSRVIPGFYLREDWLWRQPDELPSPYQVVKEILSASA
jgi:Uma2 family endonuclease